MDRSEAVEHTSGGLLSAYQSVVGHDVQLHVLGGPPGIPLRLPEHTEAGTW